AARSTCGKPGSVTCCRTNTAGRTKCAVKKDGQHCSPPTDGTACVGSYATCCDACTETGCATTTTSPPIGTCSFKRTPCFSDSDCDIPGTCAFGGGSAGQPICFQKCDTNVDCPTGSCFWSGE